MSKSNSGTKEKIKILFMMSGSIACYKACNILSRLTQNNFDVQVVASSAALQFIGNSTIEGLTGKSVITDMYSEGNVMDHIHLMRWADLIVVAPATANFINKAAQGVADDLLHTLFLAHDFKKPFLIAPAMNVAMYEHPITQSSLKKLKEIGIIILESETGALACGEIGLGRMLDPEVIFTSIIKNLASDNNASEKIINPPPLTQSERIKILVTSGGTQEPIDTVRVISNLSSGKTGVEIADKLTHLGFDVTLLRSHSSAPSNVVHNQKVFTSFSSIQKLLEDEISTGNYTHIIHLAAISDYSVDSIEIESKKLAPFEIAKLNSEAEHISLNLKKNPKLVNMLKNWSPKPLQVIAFKLTSQANTAERIKAVDKLFSQSKADIVVQNDLSEIDIINKIHKFNVHFNESINKPITGTSIHCEGTSALTQILTSIIVEGSKL